MLGRLCLLIALATLAPFSSGSFLGDRLPLQVLSVSPGDDSEQKDSTRVSKRDALTVVFSRPVIALGSDFSEIDEERQGGLDLPESSIPFKLVDLASGEELNIAGKTRWVTTYIARFDPESDWPLDLDFRLEINPALVSHDGVPLKGSASRTYKTPGMSICLASVECVKCQELTADKWDAYSASEDYSIPEVPPGATLKMEFTHPVDMVSIQNALLLSKTRGGKLTEETLTTKPCPGEDEEFVGCLLLVPSNLDSDTIYSLSLPSGTKYHPSCGGLRAGSSSDFMGLTKFTFPFSVQSYTKLSYRRYQLWLKHGVQAGDSLDDLKRSMSLVTSKQAVPFTLSRPNNGTLQLEAAFMPQQTYTLLIAQGANFRDGFGQQLQPSSFTFNTQKLYATFSEANSGNLMTFEKSQWEKSILKGTVQVFSRGNNKNSLRKLSTGPIRRSSVAMALSVGTTWSATSAWEEYDSFTQRQNSQAPFEVASVKTPQPSSGGILPLFVRQQSDVPLQGSNRKSYSGGLTSVTDMAVSAIAVGSDDLLVWVTSMSTGSPIQGADIQIFEPPEYRYNQPMQAHRLLAEGATNAKGYILLTIPKRANQYEQLRIMALTDDDAALLRMSAYDTSTDPLMGTIITDRAVYKPGDKIHIKCYARRLDGLDLKNPAAKDMKLEIDWPSGSEAVEVTWDSFGSFSVTMTVPEDSLGLFGPKSISLKRNFQHVASAGFLIADPRRPTGELRFESASSYYKLEDQSTFPLTVTTLTGTGRPIVGASVSVVWTFQRAQPPPVFSPFDYGMREMAPQEDVKPVKGTFVLVTGGNGKAGSDFDLFKALAAEGVTSVALPEEGSSLQFDASWVGPTGEVYSKTINTKLLYSDWTLDVELPTTEPMPLPGFQFGFFATLRDGSGAVKRKSVTVKLVADSGDIVYSCEARSGTGSLQCDDLQLPEMGKFQLVASAKDSSGVELSKTLELGLTEDEWKESPLKSFGQVPLRFKGESHRVGESSVLTFFSPFKTCSLLLRWGNSANTKAMIFDSISQGSNELQIPIGDECHGACSFYGIFSVARSDSADSSILTTRQAHFRLPVPVPVSKVFDPDAPTFFTSQTTLQTTKAEDLSLQVEIAAAEKASPGENVVVSISVTDSAGSPVEGDVAVFVVDQAFLDLEPHPLADLTNAFDKSQAATLSGGDSRESLVSMGAYEENVAAAIRRSQMEPWYNSQWSLRPSYYGKSNLDQTDQEALSGLVSQITKFGYKNGNQQSCRQDDNVFFGGYGGYGGYGGGGRGGYGGIAFSSAVPVAYAAMPEMSGGMSMESDSMDSMAARAPAADGAFSKKTQAAGEAPAGGAAPSKDIPVRSSLETVPLFAGSVRVADGAAKVDLKLPGNIGTFSIRAYAVGVGNRFGQAEEKVIAEKVLNLQAFLPRITRTGDKYTAGVTIAGGDPSLDCVAVVSVSAVDKRGQVHPLNIAREVASKQVRVVGTTPIRVKFALSSVALGEGQLQFTAACTSSGVESVDGLVDSIPVFQLQDAVTVATSMAITAKPNVKGAKWAEGIEFPAAVAGSGNIMVSAGVGRFPSVVSLASSLLDPSDMSDRRLQTAHLQVARLSVLFTAQAYQQGSKEVLSLGAMASGAVNLLNQYTDSELGLRWTDHYPRYNDARPDVRLNAFALYALQVRGEVSTAKRVGSPSAPLQNPPEMQAVIPPMRGGRRLVQQRPSLASISLGESEIVSGNNYMTPALPGLVSLDSPATSFELSSASFPLDVWKQAIVQEMVRKAERAVKDSYYSCCSTSEMTQVFLALGPDWKPVASSKAQDLLSWDRLVAAFNDMSLRDQAMVSLTQLVHLEGGARLALSAKLTSKIISYTRVQGRTAYVAVTPGSQHAASYETQSLCLSVLALSGATHPHVEKIANYVSQGKAGRQAYCLFSASAQETVHAALALRDYDEARNSDDADLNLRVTSGGKNGHTLLAASFDEPADPVVTASTNWSEIPSATSTSLIGSVKVQETRPAPVEFTAQGTGEVSVALSMTFIPANINPAPIYRGMYVQKTVRAVDPVSDVAIGPPLAVVQSGKIVEVTIQVTTPDDLSAVNLVDLLPGGLEALDPNVGAMAPSAPPIMPVPFMGRPPMGRGQPGRFAPSFISRPFDYWWKPFGPQETRTDRITWQASYLRAGTHSVSYRAIAVTTGTFSMPGSKAEVVSQPEVMGLSNGGVFLVVEGTVDYSSKGQKDAIEANLGGVQLEAAQILLGSIVPKECSEDCGPVGFCNLALGQCEETDMRAAPTSSSVGKKKGKKKKKKQTQKKKKRKQAP